MFSAVFNTVTVLIGSLCGMLFRKGIPERMSSAVMTGIGLCTIFMGIQGMFKGSNTLILILSTVIGVLAGTALDLDGKLNSVGDVIGRKFQSQGDGKGIAQGFVTAALLFCIGPMTIVGSLNAGLTGNSDMIMTKSIMDLFSSAVLAASLGFGVVVSSVFVLVFQGALVLLAGVLQPVLTEAAIAEMTCAGSLMILGIGLNLTGIAKVKVADYLPALIAAPVLTALASFLPF